MKFKYFMLRALYTLIVLSGALLNYNNNSLYGYLLLALGIVLMIACTYFEIKARKQFAKST
ncbi:hypothetical protein [Paucisalibacillus sp. EB02]|uniref:hypothetical protein n=1 Tax=Paucisalibacillus sp. EB02 TaxID=1347087 RepID=UPI0005AAE220|nr:hypothetical protein [Paucisalibacillus sp. EB02]